MGFFRFRHSLRILPGIRWNISKTGSSFSFGGRGFTYNIGKRGSRTTVGIPGTGLSYTTTSRRAQRSALAATTPASPAKTDGGCIKAIGLIIITVFLVGGIFSAFFDSQTPSQAPKIPLSAHSVTPEVDKPTGSVRPPQQQEDADRIPLPTGVEEISQSTADAVSRRFRIAEMARNPSHLPKTVALVMDMNFPLFYQGKQVGVARVRRGSPVKVLAINGNQLTVKYGEAQQSLSVGYTDLGSR